MADIDLEAIRRRATAGVSGHPYGDVPALLELVDRLQAKLEGPCGSCHPCTHWRDETWRRAGRKPPRVSEWDETLAELERLRADAARVEGVVDATLAAEADLARERIIAYQAAPADSAGSHAAGLAASLETLILHLRGVSRSAVRLLVEQQQTRLEIDRLTAKLHQAEERAEAGDPR